MARQYTYTGDRTISRGINSHDSIDKIPEGFAQDIINGVLEGKTIQKREGTEVLGGDMPISVEQVIYKDSTDTLELILPDYVDITDAVVGPIRLSGKITDGGGTNPYVFDNVVYPTYEKLSKLTLLASASQITASQSETRFTTVDVPFAVINADTGEPAQIGEFIIDTSDFSSTLVYDSISSDTDIILFKKEVDSTDQYNANIATGAGEFSKTITAGTHGLNTSNLFVQAYEVSGTQYTAVPVLVNIDISGNVTLSGLEESTNYRFGLYKGETVTGSTEMAVGETTVEIPNAESQYLIANFFLETPATGALERIYPDSVLYDSVTEIHTVVFKHPQTGSINYAIEYFYGQNVQNRIEIEDTDINTDYSTTEVSLVISGIRQAELPTKTFVNYLDAIRRDDKVVAGADGNLLKLVAPDAPVVALSDIERVDGDQILGPLFYSTIPSAENMRSTGYIVSSGASAGLVTISSVTYSSITTYITFRLVVTSHTAYDGSGTPTTIGAVFTSGMYVDVAGLQTHFNGIHEIKSVTEIDSDTIDIAVDISDVKSSFYDVVQTKGTAGVFTDYLTFASALSINSTDIITLSDVSELTSYSDQEAVTIQVEAATVISYVGNGTRLGITGSRGTFPLSGSSLVAGDSVQVGDVTTQITQVESDTIHFRDDVEITEGAATLSHPFIWNIVLPQNETHYLGVRPISETTIERSVNANNQLIFAKNIKYNGDTWETDGLPGLQAQLFAHIDETETGKIDVPINHITIDTTGAVVTGTTTIPVSTANELKTITEGTRLLLRDETNDRVYSDSILTVTDIDETGSTVTINPGLPADATLGGTFKLAEYIELDYFARVAYNFENTEAVGPSTGSGDLRFRLTSPAALKIRAFRPTFENFNFDDDSLVLEIFRRLNGGSYRKILQSTVSQSSLYTDLVDAVPLLEPGVEDEDQIPEPLSGRIGETRSGPYVSTHITNIDNQIIKTNLTGIPTTLLDFTALLETADLSSSEWIIDSDTYAVTTSEITPSSIVGGVGSFTINTANTGGLTTDDYVYICHVDPDGIEQGIQILGWWAINAVVTNTSITILHPDIGTLTAADTTSVKVFYVGSGKIPLVTNTDYHGIGASVGKYNELQNAFCFHFADAINWRYNTTDIYARGGRDLINGRLTVYGHSSFTYASTIPGLFVNGVDVSGNSATATDAITPTYPSRAIASLKNYTDIYIDIDAEAGTGLPAVEDINPDDGENLVASIPFFSESAFGAAQQSNVLVLFKSHNIYIMDVTAKYAGATDYLKRLNIGGKGCDAPHSLSQTDLGIMYAGRAGIYLLDRGLNVQYVGKNFERFWEKTLVDLTLIERCCANNWINGRRYSLSIPVKNGEGYTDSVATFKTPLLDGSEGDTSGWARFSDAYNATMWTNTTSSTLFASGSEGFVGIVKVTGELEDYSDRGEAIELQVLFRPMAFDYPSIKKFLRRLTIFFTSQAAVSADEFDVEIATNLNTRFDTLDLARLSKTEQINLDNLSDTELNQVSRLTYSPKTQRGSYFQLRVTARGVNKDMIISQVIHKVAFLRQRGSTEAAVSVDSGSTISGD